MVSIELELPFESDWDGLVHLSSALISSTELQTRASEWLRAALKRAGPALQKPYDAWLTEDYHIVYLQSVAAPSQPPLPAGDLLATHAQHIVQLVRGESTALSVIPAREISGSTPRPEN